MLTQVSHGRPQARIKPRRSSHRHLSVFSHPVTDIASFRFFTSQLIANGNASQSEISRAFGVPLVSVKRACKKLRDEGAAGFFRPPVPRQAHKLTEQRHPQSHRHRTQGHRNLLSRHHPPPRLPPNQVIHFPAKSGCLKLGNLRAKVSFALKWVAPGNFSCQ